MEKRERENFKMRAGQLISRLTGWNRFEARIYSRLESSLEARIDSRFARDLGAISLMQKSLLENFVASSFNLAAKGVQNAPRSVLFLHQSYYHFYFLARALRERGWNAQTIDFETPGSIWKKYSHGTDLHFSSDDSAVLGNYREAAYSYVRDHFEMIHFAGDGQFSFFPERFGLEAGQEMLDWRAQGKKIGYTISGCNSGVSSETVAKWSLLDGRNVCDTCIWNDRPDVCSPEKSRKWAETVEAHCDLIAAETAPALGVLESPQVVLEPLTMCVDPDRWHPELQIPAWAEVLRQNEEEVLIYHGMGEADLRSDQRRNIKGTPAIVRAVERLSEEGHPVRLVFKSGVPNIFIHFFQVQSDIIVDQLNYGRYGAQAREGMMLGKPVVCYINRNEPSPGVRNRALEECPLVSATEESIYEVLKELVQDKAKREKIGRDSRDYALKWHSPDRCAERFERVYDALQAGRPLSEVDLD